MATGSRRAHVAEDALIEAFQRASDGYASDRVIADPVLNAAFVDHCGALGLPGRPRDWNLNLLALRKAGKLAKVPAAKRTQFSWQQMDPFLFASEIALRRMLDLGYPSLDFILCDPLAAARFDQFARSLAPGFSSLNYRWAAFRLRKDARLWRRSSEKFADKALRRSPRRIVLDETAISRLDGIPAVYLLSMIEKTAEARPVYVGETCNLEDRAQRTLSARRALDQFLPNTGQWQLELFEHQDLDQDGRRGLQSLLIGRNRPVMNYLELAGERS